MAEQQPSEGASTSRASVPSSDSTIELNIKTLNSQIYSFHADKKMRVSSFKEKIADQISIPVAQQRLIFRGKVLKDEHLLSEYHMENGDTLHLVERQPTQPQSSSADSSVNSGAQGNNGGAGATRIGQVSHSVVLGSFNVGDQGEVTSDISRVIGSVLSSLGLGNQAINAAAAQNAAPQNSPGLQGSGTEQVQGSTQGQSHAGNQAQFGQPFSSQPFQMPSTGASVLTPVPIMPIPDSLNTLSEFMTQMEGVLSQIGNQSNSSPSGITNQPSTTELPRNARGLPNPESLSIVLRQAQRLLSGQAVTSLSHIAGRLEQESGSTDSSVRNQIQTESLQVGRAMQHLGALFLELGRTMMMLRMGQYPAGGVVGAGPAVYISPSGPNPIMVQPVPYQPSSLFNPPAASAPNAVTPAPVGIIGSAPRNINVHIHAGTSIAPIVNAVGTRAAGGEGAQGEGNNSTGSGDSASTRVLPAINVIATTVPRTATIAISPIPNVPRPVGSVSGSQPIEAATLSSHVSQVNSQIRNLIGDMQTGNPAPSAAQQDNVTIPNTSFSSSEGTPDATDDATLSSLVSEINSNIRDIIEGMQTAGQQDNVTVPNDIFSSGGGTLDATDSVRNLHSDISREAIDRSVGSVPELQAQDDQTEKKEMTSTSSQSGEKAVNSECSLLDIQKSGDSDDKSDGVKDVPIGLGGGLQPKRRSRPANMPHKSGEGDASNSDQSQQARTSGQQILQTLASRSVPSRTVSNDTASRQVGQGDRQTLGSTQVGTHGQQDITGMVSQLLDSSALNGLLSGVAQQTGVGSPDALRNMMQQFMQNPAMMNTVNQLAQQVDREEFRDAFAGMGSGPEGDLDISSMFQQMMPVVSQVLGCGSVRNEQLQSMVPELPSQFGDRSSGVHGSLGQSFQNELHEVIQRIAHQDPPQDIFGALVQSAAEVSGIAAGELADELCGIEDLVNQFVDVLHRDMRRQL